jgi:hypothetical protein
MHQSAGDTSYIKEQPGIFSLWCDNPTATPVITLAQATSQGFIPGLPPPQITAPPPPPPPQPPIQPRLALPAPPPIMQYFGDYARGFIPQEFTPMRPDSRFQEPNIRVEFHGRTVT